MIGSISPRFLHPERKRKHEMATNSELVSLFFILGKSPKEWDETRSNWDDFYADSVGLSWQQFEKIAEENWTNLFEGAAHIFKSSLLSLDEMKYSYLLYEAITADWEEWSDFFQQVIFAEDFEDLWGNSWLTQDDMRSSLQDFIQATPSAIEDIARFQIMLSEWFESDLRVEFTNTFFEFLKQLDSKIAIILEGLSNE